MGDFLNTTLGVGTSIQVDGADIGFTKGDIQMGRNVETKDFDSGIPIQTQGRVIFKEAVEVIVPMSEITPENLSYAALNVPVSTIAGGNQSVNDAANQERTFAAFGGGGIERIKLDGGTVTNLVVKNTAEDTTYTANDDYILDAVTGYVYRNPGGAITSGQTVRVAYDYVAVASKRLNFGKNLAITNRSFQFTHVSPVSGDTHTLFIPKANAQGTLDLTYREEEYMTVQLNLKAVPDPTNYPDSPLGYFDIAPAA